MKPAEAQRLRSIAKALDRLRYDHRDPETFHIVKHDLAAELRELAGVPRPQRSMPGRAA